jgi:hypothetical protein
MDDLPAIRACCNMAFYIEGWRRGEFVISENR